MKILTFFAVLVLTTSAFSSQIKSKATPLPPKEPAVDVYTGLSLEAITQPKTDGTNDSEGRFGFGLQSLAGYKNFGLGLSYRYFKDPQEGNSTVNVEQSNHWLLFDAAFRFMPETNIVPYAFVGFGPIYKTVKTQFQSETESHTGSYLTRSIGGGCMIKTENQFAFNFALRYYQYEAMSGFLVTFGAGLDFLTGLKF